MVENYCSAVGPAPHLMNESLLRREAAMRGSLKETRGCQSAKRRFVAAGTRSDARPNLYACMHTGLYERKTRQQLQSPLFFLACWLISEAETHFDV